MDVTRTVKVPHVLYTRDRASSSPGVHTMTWAPAATTNPRTFLVRLTAVDRAGNQVVYGAPNAFVGRAPKGVVVRIQGIDAGVRAAELRARADGAHPRRDRRAGADLRASSTPGRSRSSPTPTTSSPASTSATPPVTLDWTRVAEQAPHDPVPSSRTSRAASTTSSSAAPDGRVGYAPFVVRPATLGTTSRVLVILPTNTWQAYNFQDVDGNGYGDTWYAGPPNRTVDLSRTYIARGVPPRFYRYDLPFLHWLYWSGKSAEFISDSDFDPIALGRRPRTRVRPDRLRGARGVRHLARVRRRRSATATSAAT